MKKSRLGLVLAVTTLSLFSSGCFRAVRLERMGYEILDACPDARFKKDVSISIGGASWGLLKSIAMSVEKNDRELRAYIGNLDKIEVVVYEARGISKRDLRPIGEIVKQSLDDDWRLMLKTAEDGDMVWIHYREDDERIREMNVVAYDGDEFVIVRLWGSLDEIMEVALEDHGDFTDKIVHSAR
jgi:hypothetical protein